MSSLNAEFTRDDVELLIEAVGDWETVGNHEYHVLNMIKSVPMPPEDHEAFEPITQLKDYFKGREKDILASRVTRQEKAIFLKAKLMMVRRDLGINALFDMAANGQESTGTPAPKENSPQNESSTPTDSVFVSESRYETLKKKLELAEEFITGMGQGVVKYYEKFLEENKNPSCESTE